MRNNLFSRIVHLCLGCSLALVLAACGGSSDPANAPATSTPIPTYSFSLPTEAPAVATAAATLASGVSTELDPEMVERGKGRYDALECASCHGADGAGTDKGISLIASTIDEEAFIGFMRSGGTLGASHQYATNRLSDSGGKNLYQYLLSLRQAP